MNKLPENFDLLSAQEKRALLSRILQQEIKSPRIFPLSFSQERLWFLNQLEGPSATYNIWMGFTIKGEIHIEYLEKSINAMIERHEILRTTFMFQEGKPVQVAAGHLTVKVPVLTLQNLAPGEQEQKIEELLIAESQQAFDLAKGPLLRIKLLSPGEKEYILIIIMHHIIFDAWSTQIFFQETLTFYDSFVKGIPVSLPALPLQFGDFSTRQREWLSGAVLEKQVTYWKNKMSGAPQLLELPLDFPRPPEQTFQGKVEHFNIDFDLKEKLQRLSLASDATLFMVLLSSFAVILSRYSSQEDIVIGTPIANRNSRELEALIGFFINTLTIRIDLSNPSTFLELLKRVQNNCLEAYAYQDIPFEKLVEELQIERNPGYTPLFQVLFTLHHAGDNEFYLPGLVIRPLEIERLSSKFDLSLQLSESKLFISGSLEYNIHLFKSETIRRFIRCFLQALTIIADNPGVKLTDIEILPASERQQILYEFNNTASEYHKDKTVHQLFTGQAAQTPDYIALHGCMIAWMDACMDEWMHDCMDGEVALNVSLTYRQLNEQSDRLAGLLIEKGIGPDIIVALMMERSVEMIAGILGILKSGGAYLPIDPEYPQERIEYMLKDSAARILLTDDEKKTDNCQCSIVNCQLSMSERPRRGLLHSAFRIPHSNHLAYTIYTSGSTGKPKGVMIEHRAVVNFIKGITGIIPFTDSGRILSLTTVSFDIFGLETLLPLTRGTLIVIGNREEQLNALAAAKAIQRENITIFQVTPSRLQLFINDPAFAGALVCLKYLLVGGEVFPARLLEKIKQLTKGRIFNVYGPTETTIWSTIKEVTQTNSLTIGKPLANTQIYILDKHGLPQPIGVPGDLIIAGDGVARGYLNNPELTRKKFRPLIPLMTQMSLMKNKNNALRALDGCPRRGLQHSAFCIQHSNLYCTGDLARWLPDGDIEFLGRKDKQVKIRGYRIELDDIENQLLKYPGVQDVVVIVQADDSGDHFLSAYIVLHPDSSPGFDTSSLKQFLQEKIPAYMVPDYYVYLDKIPLNASGKVDIHSLPPVQSTRPAVKATYVAPNNELEQLITDTWKKVLKLENIGIYDNFFELGGNSFKVIELNTALGQTLKREIPVAVLFKYITIHSFTQYLIKEDMAPPTFPIESRKKPAAGQQSQRGKTDIAVIGMAGRFPGAANIDQFWENLKNGIESISFIPAAGTEKMGVPLEWRNNENYVGSLGGVLEGRDLFDANFFGYTPLEAEVMDPQMRLLHECVWETLENAGYEPGNYEGRIGLYAGASHNFYWESLVHMSGKSRELGGFLSLQFIGRDFLATRISYKLDLKGPCLNVQTACSTSLVAIHLACRAIWEDECDMALAGGVRVDAQDAHGYLYQEGMIHSKDGHCRAFDENASGTIGGNGAGVVMLKALPDALRDNDHIYALVKSTAINNDGTQKAGYTAPSIDGQAKVIKEAMEMAHVEPRSITYIEAHGTGTTLGDPIEIEALKMAFAVQEKGFCRIGSVKTNIGHLDAAAGAAGFIKTVLALKHRLIPPSLNFSHPNPRIDFKNSPFIVNDRLTQWENQGDPPFPLRAGVSSFGIGGTNAHVILEEWPGQGKRGQARKRGQTNLILLSAQTPTALDNMTGNLATYLHTCLNAPGNVAEVLDNIAYTLQVGRRSFRYKRMLLCSELVQAVTALTSPGLPDVQTFKTGTENPRVVFVFPGQGSQYVNMGRELYETQPYFREKIDTCFEILKPIIGLDIKTILYPPPAQPGITAAPGDPLQLQQTGIAQPVLFAFEYALAMLLMKWGPVPYAMIGHSIGEYVAACLSGVFTLPEALKVVAKRGKLMQQMPAGEMLSVSLSEEKLQKLLMGGISLAAINGPSRCVVSGPPAAIESFINHLNTSADDCQYRRLHTSHAFHSAMMDPVLNEFEQELKGMRLGKPRIPYISNVSGNWITEEEAVAPHYWARQLREPVRFHDGIQALANNQPGNVVFIEIGPGNTLTNLIRQDSTANIPNTPSTQKVAVNLVRHPGEDVADDHYLLNKIGQLWLYAVKIDWQALHTKEKKRVPLPTYPFERRHFWIDIQINQPGEYILQSPVNYREPHEPGTDSPVKETGHSRLLSERPALTTSYAAPQNKIEQQLVRIWENFFGIGMIGTNDDFFELGGDSLKATGMIAKIHKEMNLKIELAEVFKNPNIARLAAYALSIQPLMYEAIPPVEKKQYYELSYSQQRLWFISRTEIDNPLFNMREAMILPDRFDENLIRKVWQQLSMRHESLRTAFKEIVRVPVQVILPIESLELDIEVIDLIGIPGVQQDQARIEIFKNESLHVFNLERAPLYRIKIIKTKENEFAVVFNIHHIITDGWSMEILKQEFHQLYNAYKNEVPYHLESVTIQYKDFAAWHNRLLSNKEQLQKAQDFWKEQLSGNLPPLSLPYQGARLTENKDSSGYRTVIPGDTLDRLRLIAEERQASLFMLLLTAFNMLLAKVTGQKEIIMAIPAAARKYEELRNIIGMFVNVLILRNTVSMNESFPDFFKRLQANTFRVLEYQDFPLELIFGQLGMPYPEISVFFNMLNLGTAPRQDIIDLVSHHIEKVQNAKFDIVCYLAEYKNGIEINCHYFKDLFKPATIEMLMKEYIKTLTNISADPTRYLREYFISGKKRQLKRGDT